MRIFYIRSYTRVRIWIHIIQIAGHKGIVMEALIYSLVLFVVSVIVSSILNLSLCRAVSFISNRLEKKLKKGFDFCWYRLTRKA